MRVMGRGAMQVRSGLALEHPPTHEVPMWLFIWLIYFHLKYNEACTIHYCQTKSYKVDYVDYINKIIAIVIVAVVADQEH